MQDLIPVPMTPAPMRALDYMKLFIRAAYPSDAVEFARIGVATFALACPPSTPEADIAAYIASELTPARFATHLACGTRSLFAAVVDHAVVGYLMLCREGAPPEVPSLRALELRRLYVLSQYHGTGVATALMDQALQTARSEAYSGLWLGVSKQNSRGIRFYRKHGFTVVGEQRFPVGSDVHEDFIMMRGIEEAQQDAPADGTKRRS